MALTFEDIQRWAAELGFQQVGIADLDLAEQAPHLRRWLERGFHGEMGYMARNLEKRLHPAQLEAGTCSVICARMNYLPEGSDGKAALADGRRAYLARYALGRDYHKLMRRRLARLARRIDQAARQVDARFRAFADSAPVLEKALAEKAGLGWMGKHTLLIHPDAGSWFFLGEIYTNLKLPSTGPAEADHCGSCKACMTVCPTGAIIGPKQLDARRCISYLTIEHKSAIPEELRPLIGNRIFGCDDCQLHCPWNRQAPTTEEEAFLPRRLPPQQAGQTRSIPANGLSLAPSPHQEPAGQHKPGSSRMADAAVREAEGLRTADRARLPAMADAAVQGAEGLPPSVRQRDAKASEPHSATALGLPRRRRTTASDAKASDPHTATALARGFDKASLLELFAWDEAAFLRNTEGSAIRRIGFQRWQRNLAVALGNGPASPAAIAALRERLPQASALVQEHIEWALRRLTSKGAAPRPKPGARGAPIRSKAALR